LIERLVVDDSLVLTDDQLPFELHPACISHISKEGVKSCLTEP
jgi:hypothetical protein